MTLDATANGESSAPQLGDRYEIIRELGRGGMAIVYLVRDRNTGAECAIKVIHTKFLGDSEAMARFDREARLVSELKHPRIVATHSIEQLPGVGLGLVMDHVDGKTVRQLVRERGPLPAEQVASILIDVAEALGHAHQHGVVHRDVKPENIFVETATGRALLSDFGIARSMAGETELTLAGVALGTPTYMAPEQIDRPVLDARSDLYSLGLVGWEMLTGRRPWDGETLYNIIYRQKHDDLPAVTAIRPGVPDALAATVDCLLAKSPSERCQSADELRAILAGERPVRRRVRATELDAAATTRVERAWDRPRRHTLLRRPIAVVALLLATSGSLLLALSAPASWRHTNAKPPARHVNVATPHAPALVTTAPPRVLEPPPVDSSAAADDSAVNATYATAIPARQFAPAVAGAPVIVAPGAAAERTITPPARLTPVAAPEVHAPAANARFAIASGGAHTCFISADGDAHCWGANGSGQLGAGIVSRTASLTSVSSAPKFGAIAAGLSHTCALSSGAAYCWGDNDHGQLGDGSQSQRTAPVRAAEGHTFMSIVAGSAHTCGLGSDGRVFCWGSNERGQLGNAASGDRTSATAVAGGMTFGSIVSGWNHVCALSDAGRAYCWGANDAGQLGDGTTTDRMTPVAVRGAPRFVSLSAGSAHTCGVTNTGAAYCWGSDRYGQLGDGATVDRASPAIVDGPEPFVAVYAGALHTCALTRSRQAYCWGRNSYGQLGDGTNIMRARPTRVAGDHAFASLSAFGAHTCGATVSEELFCWGYNLDGELGDGTRDHRSRPTYVEKPAGE